MIKREKYLERIRPFYDREEIKIITGIRRSGKSTLLEQIMDEIDSKNIIYINFEDLKYDHLRNYKKLYSYLIDKINTGRYYLFFDEIQQVDEWERVINSFRTVNDVSIFITGSNSNLLSSELSTLIAGRYISFKMYPFTYIEYLESSKKEAGENSLNDFLLWGSLPQVTTLQDEKTKKLFLSDVFESIVYKDIASRHNVKKTELLNRITMFLITLPGTTFSSDSIIKYLKQHDLKTSNATIYKYLDYLIESFLLVKVPSYDLKGKKLLTRNDKYYLTDLGLGQVNNHSDTLKYGLYLENAVFNYLVYQGYEVTVGKLNKLEVDFIACKHGKKIYVQVAYYLSGEEVIEREFNSLEQIKDNLPKYIISMDKENFSRDGIKHINASDFFLNEEF